MATSREQELERKRIQWRVDYDRNQQLIKDMEARRINRRIPETVLAPASAPVAKQAEEPAVQSGRGLKFMEDKFEKMQRELEKYKRDLASLEQQLADSLAREASGNAEVASLKQQVADKDKINVDLNCENEELRRYNEQLNKAMTIIRTNASNDLQKQLIDETQKWIQCNGNVAEIKNDLDALQRLYDDLINKKAVLEYEKNDLKNTLEKRIARLENDLDIEKANRIYLQQNIEKEAEKLVNILKKNSGDKKKGASNNNSQGKGGGKGGGKGRNNRGRSGNNN